MFVQFRPMSPFTPRFKQQQFALIRSLQQRSFEQLFSSQATSLSTRLTIFFLKCHYVVCPTFFYRRISCLMNCTWGRMFLPWLNLYKSKHYVSVIIICVFCLCLSLQSCCCLFILYSPFFILLLFIRWSCKQTHYFNFWSFCLWFYEHHFDFCNNNF